MTGPRKWKYIKLNISGTKQNSRIKKAYFIFLKGFLTDCFAIAKAIYNATYNVVQIQRLKKTITWKASRRKT